MEEARPMNGRFRELGTYNDKDGGQKSHKFSWHQLWMTLNLRASQPDRIYQMEQNDNIELVFSSWPLKRDTPSALILC